MPENYYDDATSYPAIIIPILERIRLYFCTLLYPDEDYQTESKERFIRTDISDFAMRDASRVFNLTNASFPFTAFSMQDDNIKEDVLNHYALSGHYFSSDFQSLVSAIPMIWEIPMITYFARGHDYVRAMRILTRAKVSKIKLDVPVVINSVTTTFPIVLEMEINKGSYAFEFAEQLRVGKIHDIVHNIRVSYYDYQINATISPVDDIEMALATYAGSEYRDSSEILSTLMPVTPVISSTTPVSGSLSVAVDQTILINFNTPMDEDSVEDALDIDPFFTYDLAWESDSTGVAIDPVNSFVSGTLYTIEISDLAESGWEIPLEEDFDFSFTTE